MHIADRSMKYITPTYQCGTHLEIAAIVNSQYYSKGYEVAIHSLKAFYFTELKMSIERFLIECRKTKTKVITTANQNEDKCHKEPIRTES